MDKLEVASVEISKKLGLIQQKSIKFKIKNYSRIDFFI